MRTFFSSVLFLILLLCGLATEAADRVQSIQSKVHQALGGLLPRTDYLVIINRLDPLEDDLLSTEISGAVKNLPGLSVGVDAKGQIVRKDNQAGQYLGPVSINIILDKNVRNETVKTISDTLPEIVGGLNDQDEVKVSQAVLRQPPPPNAAGITINNQGAEKQTQASELMKFLAIMLMIAGVFAWMLSRASNKNSGRFSNGNSGSRYSENGEPEQEAVVSKKSEIGKLNPASVGLFLLKSLKTESLMSPHWFSNLSLEFQRSVFLTMPAWVSASLEKTLSEQMNKVEFQPQLETELYRQITVLEQNFKDEYDWKKAFILWFPAPCLRFVPKQYQEKLSSSSRKTLGYYRPELGEFVRASEIGDYDMNAEPSELAVTQLYADISAWPSNLFASFKHEQTDVVGSWAAMLNNLTEFGPLESQLAQAKEKLTEDQFEALQKKVAHPKSPFSWDGIKVKLWLRQVDPQDYYWWLSMHQQEPEWMLEDELRPLRLSMFRVAKGNLAYPTWSEAQKKASNLRLIQMFRAIHLGEELHEDMAA